MNDEERKEWHQKRLRDLIRHDNCSLRLYHQYNIIHNKYDPRKDKTHRCYGCKYLDGNSGEKCEWCSRLFKEHTDNMDDNYKPLNKNRDNKNE